MIIENRNHPQVKVCGLTDVKEAVETASLGADAIGLVFFSKSPRNLSLHQAKEISSALPDDVATVGVFVNESYTEIMRIVEYCRLKAVQLHGKEAPDLVKRLAKEDLRVIKALFVKREPSINAIDNYDASAYLVECGRGALPGGNALTWNWSEARNVGKKHPLILAGGLTPGNVAEAIESGMPDAVDVSSGVEASPGKKDLSKVKSFIATVSCCEVIKKVKSIF
ncbi:MAG: phosphoribosylanthranilate isomerase [Deltaproteobacteria bacterium]|nr:phosphoribosylanthranilate isomerase [Deltaproteobacteria bacterium]